MPDADHFGSRLRRQREQRGISLDALAAATKVSVDLWEGLEQNDLRRWPSGVSSRAFLRDYARTIGLDADAVVDEFCRHFPLADRRTTRIVEAQAELIGHEHDAGPDPLPAGRERRRDPRTTPKGTDAAARTRYAPRLLAAGIDLSCIGALALAISLPTRVPFWTAVGAVAVVYHAASTIVAGTSPGNRISAALRLYAPALFGTARRPTLAR